ncbi:MAG TPA: ABC transporter permease [Anaerolineaceae bacterium]|nr:ABC transporter permease [Anaerolineaceae bacterium]
MKSLAIACKDLTHSFRSTFAIIFMFGVPLMVTGLFYLMFGSLSVDKSEFNLPPTKVVIVNLDAGDPQAGQLGQILMAALQSEDFASLMEISLAPDSASARRLVDTQQAGVALIIPADFSTAFTDSQSATQLELYSDPTLTIGPGIVRSIINQFTDQFSGIKITVALALQQAETGQIEYAQIETIVADYLVASQTSADPQSLIETVIPTAAPQQNFMLTLIGPIMAGMLVFYAFYTGVNTAMTILKEREEGTLSRLFTTPTSQTEILGGKWMAVGLTVLVQVVTLLLVSRLIFQIDWGHLPVITLVALAIVCSASASGIFLCSWLKNTRQGGIVFGGVLTVTGMVGMMDVFTGNPGDPRFGFWPLITPQGWAARGLLAAMNGGSITQILPYVLGLIAISILFFIIGVLRFQKRFA